MMRSCVGFPFHLLVTALPTRTLFAMRNLIVGGALLAAVATAFSPAAVTSSHSASLANNSRSTVCFSSVTNSADCGCGGATTISGSPSKKARLINPREALSKSTVYRLDGSSVSVSNLLTDGVNLVVVTRSFGWPFCQEQIIQYDKLLDKTKFNFVLISIGKPEIGMELCDHLGIENGQEYIYADPENDCYSNLALNSGWNTMIRPATVSLFRFICLFPVVFLVSHCLIHVYIFKPCCKGFPV